MPTAREFIPSRTEAGEEISPRNSTLGIPSKSFVVGRYSPDGRLTARGGPADDERTVSKHTQLLLESMQSRGKIMKGYEMTPNGPVKIQASIEKTAAPKSSIKNKKPAVSIKTAKIVKYEEPVQYAPEVEDRFVPEDSDTKKMSTEKKGFNVVYGIESGKVKSTCDAVLENDLAVMLVYSNEDSISYLPEKGSELVLTTPDRREIPVMYLGLQFEWHNSRQQLLVFMKTELTDA